MSTRKKHPFLREARFSSLGVGAPAVERFENNVARKFAEIDAYQDSTQTSGLSGDVTGALDSSYIAKLQGHPVAASAPQTGSLLWFDGTNWVPIRNKPRVLDATYAPVGLWNFHLGAGVGLKDYSGNGRDLTVETGTARYSAIHPALGGLLFDGSTNLIYSTFASDFNILGAFTGIALVILSALPSAGNTSYIFSHSAAFDGTANTNHAYDYGVDSNNAGAWFSKHGVGTVDSFPSNSFCARGQISLMGVTRDSSGSVQYYFNGAQFGAPSTITLPTGGTSARFRIGANSTASTFFTGVISSVAIYNVCLTAAQMQERYDYCLAYNYGYK